MRPTGKLHIGHYFGVLRNWVELQNSDNYNCYFFIADWHSLTTKNFQSGELRNNIIEITRDFLACGLDPSKSTIFVQSAVKEIAELQLLLSMITPNNWTEGDPTLKDLVKAKNGELTYGMLGYPVLQTADITTFKGSLVPVGKDQQAHLEISRDIVRRFNSTFKTDLFELPKALLTDTPALLGTDGQKMSKSYRNDIKISDTRDEIEKKVKYMITDTERTSVSLPGNTLNCKVPFPYYQELFAKEISTKVKSECETAKRGCFACKMELAELIDGYFKEIREKRGSYTDEEIVEILIEGNRKATQKAKETLAEVKDIMNITIS